MSSVNGTISLREANQPLGSGEGRFNLEAGALLRGEVRRAAAQCGVDWFEQKNFLDSYFVFRGDSNDVLRLYHAIKNYEREMEEAEA